MTEENRTEAESIAALAARPCVNITFLDIPDVFNLSTPPEWETQTIDFEGFRSQPRRPRGLVEVHTADAFTQAIKTRRASDNDRNGLGLYANEETMALVAINNDHYGDIAGWRDDRVRLALRRRPEWQAWRDADGKMMEQEAFALFIEDALAEIVDPAPATMLDLAQTFQAHTGAAFKSGKRLASGEVQFLYEETTTASAGTGGDIGVPEELALEVVPFFGAHKYQVTARFRFTLRQGELRLGYKLNRPDDVERFAFLNVATEVAGSLGVAALEGIAPDPILAAETNE